MAGAVGLGAFAGYGADRGLHSSPWGVILGVLIGVAAGMYLLIKEALRMNKD